MQLFTASYRSTACLTDTFSDLASILESSMRNNRALNVSGVLLFDGTYFLQTLEGRQSDVSEIFIRLLDDSRHRELIPFGVGELQKRAFPDWSMKLVSVQVSRQVAPDLNQFDFSARRLSQIHRGVLAGS